MDFFREIVYNIIAGRDTLYTRVIELTFKRYVISSTTGTALGRFFFTGENV